VYSLHGAGNGGAKDPCDDLVARMNACSLGESTANALFVTRSAIRQRGGKKWVMELERAMVARSNSPGHKYVSGTPIELSPVNGVGDGEEVKEVNA